MCSTQKISLAEFIEDLGVEEAQKFLSVSFRCQRNSDLALFLTQKAIRFETVQACSTHLIMRKDDILAYFSLSFKEIEINVSNTLLRKLTGGLNQSNKIKVFLIGQIGKNDLIEDNPVHLADILKAIYDEINNARRSVGGRVAILECENNAKLISLYEQNGFKLIDTVDDKHQLKTLFIIPKMRK